MSESAEGSAQVLAEALRAEAEAIERDPAVSNDAAEVLRGAADRAESLSVRAGATDAELHQLATDMAQFARDSVALGLRQLLEGW